MKKNTLLSFVLMIAGIGLLGFLGAWWLPVLWIVLISILMKPGIKASILLGAVSFGLVWVCMALYMSALDSNSIIEKTGTLLGGLSQPLMVLVILIIAMITGSLSGWFGGALGRYFERKTPQV